MKHQLNTQITDAAREVLKAEAEARGVSARSMLGIILETVLVPGGTLALLQDTGKAYPLAQRRTKGTGRKRDIRHVEQNHNPDRKLNGGSVVQERRKQYDRPMRHAPTKADMQEDLRQAVLNTK